MAKKVKALPKQYAIWVPPEGTDSGYYCYYDSIEDAASDYSEPIEIFEATLKSLGLYTTKVVAVKVK